MSPLVDLTLLFPYAKVDVFYNDSLLECLLDNNCLDTTESLIGIIALLKCKTDWWTLFYMGGGASKINNWIFKNSYHKLSVSLS